MARLQVTGTTLLVRLSTVERLGALAHNDPEVPLTSITAVRAVESPWKELKGLRAPGTGWPGVIALGTWRRRSGKDFVAVYRSGPGVVVELEGAPWRRLIVSASDAVRVAADIESLLPSV